MRDFLRYTFASVLGTLVGLGLLFTLGVGGLIFLVAVAASSSKDPEPKVENKSVLVFDLSMTITDAKPVSSTGEAIQEVISDEENADTVTLRTVLDSIDEATRDKRIVGIYLNGTTNSGSTGFATLKEVRSALERFRDAGKKIVAYDMDWTEREYYLGSVANEIVLNPLGVMELNGLSSAGTFYAGAFQKYGIGVQVTRVGKYKAAVEPFLLTKNSPENREQTQKLLGDIWSDFLSTVGKYKKLSPQQLQQITDNRGILMAMDARDQKLVDRVAYFDEVVADLRKLTESKEKDRTFRQISLQSYGKIVEDKGKNANSRSKNEIAIVYADGEIVNGEGGAGDVGGDRIAKQLRELRQNKDVKAVVLRVNSPGGSATASEVIQREVKLTREAKKPVVVSMGDVAASGGYWISSYADKIFAEPNTITGSIGVFGLLLNVQDLANNNGITWDVVKTGRYADIETITRPKTEQELAINQRMVDDIYERFLDLVAKSRDIPKEKVAQIAQGRVWSGVEAKKLKLIDEIGGIEEAIQAAAKLANLGDNWKLEEYPKTRSLEERIIEKLTGATVGTPMKPTDPLTAQFQKLQEDLAILRSMNDPAGAYARLPYNLRID